MFGSQGCSKAPYTRYNFSAPEGACGWRRYDDRKHWLFRTLHNEHHLDYHQACIAKASPEKGGEFLSLSFFLCLALHLPRRIGVFLMPFSLCPSD